MKYLTWAALMSIVFFACKEDPRQPTNIVVKTRDYSIPPFNKDSAWSWVNAQVAFGPRVPGTEAHTACAEYLIEKLKSFGLEARQETIQATRYDGTPMKGFNIMGQLNPKAQKRVFIAAHWDSRFMADFDTKDKEKAILGADDGASGVGVCLEVARILAKTQDFQMGLDVVFFDLEDQGEDGGNNSDSWGIGAQRWSNAHKGHYRPEYGILLDMVGAGDARFYQEGYSMQTAPMVVNKVWKTADRLGYGHVFIAQQGRGIVDDHYFVHRNAGWPVIDIIHTDNTGSSGFGDHWHTHDDNMDVIDRNMLGTVGKVITTVLCHEDLNKPL